MELTTTFSAEYDLRVHTSRGELVLEELLETLRSLYESPEFRPEQNSLWDVREARLEGLSSDQVKRIGDLVSGHWGKQAAPKSALVASKDLAFGLARMYEARLESRGQVRVFREMEEALSWLGSAAAP